MFVLKDMKGQKNRCLIRFNETALKTGRRILRLRRILGIGWNTVLKSVKIGLADRTVKQISSSKKMLLSLYFVLRHKKANLRHQKKGSPHIYVYIYIFVYIKEKKICPLYINNREKCVYIYSYIYIYIHTHTHTHTHTHIYIYIHKTDILSFYVF